MLPVKDKPTIQFSAYRLDSGIVGFFIEKTKRRQLNE